MNHQGINRGGLRFIGTVMIIVMLCVGCGKNEEGDGNASALREQQKVLFEQIRDCNRMTFATMTISKTGVYNDDVKWKIGDRIGVYSYDTYLTAYIDLNKLNASDIEFDDATREVRIKLPAIETRFDGRDVGMREEHYRVTGLRSSISAKERAALKERMNSELKKEVENNTTYRETIIETAERKARHYFQQLFAANGYSADIEFKK